MAGKRGLGWMGTGTLVFVGVFGFHGCLVNPPCGCSEPEEMVVMQVRDENGPVDSARISVFHAGTGLPIDTALSYWDQVGPGAFVVFDHADIRAFSPGADSLEVRVVARKAGKSGEATVTVSVNAQHHDLRKISGPDTITIR